MSPIAAALIVVSAFTHAGWNLLGKRRCTSPAFFLVANAAAVVCLGPLLIYFRETLPLIPGSVWMMLAATGAFQALYFAGLGWAYASGDMSLVYPLARAMPVLIVFAVTHALGRGHEVGRTGAVGMVLVALGCLMLPMRRLRDLRPGVYLRALLRQPTPPKQRRLRRPEGYGGQRPPKLRRSEGGRACCLLALVAAVGTAGYSMIDDEALRRLRGLEGGAPIGLEGPLSSALVYIALETICTLVFLACLVLPWRSARSSLADTVRRSPRHAVVAGVVISGTYALVLTSMAFVENVSYVVAFRQLSVPIGAVLGMAILKEPRYPLKLLGITVVSAGLVLVGLG